jgi:orotidine-5'-phosphate decarboxylase
MLEDAKAAAGINTKVVAVTVLTSLDNSDLVDIGVGSKAEDQVTRLADLAHGAGLDGIVCSGEEVALAKRAWADGFFVVPGVRPAGGTMADQKRAVTPREALDRGASILVVGRPISLAENPDLAAREIEATL